MQRFLILVYCSILLFTGCSVGDGGSSRPSEALPGTYLNKVESITYSPIGMQQNLLDQICFNLPLDSTTCADNIATLANNNSFNFTLSQITESVTAYNINYVAPGIDGHVKTLSGAVIIPNIPSQNYKGIVLYYHGTTANKATVPSNFESNFGQDYSYTLASVYASQGYVVVAPDYIGFGVDNQVLHPYMLWPQVNAQDGLYMLQAARQFLNNNNIFSFVYGLNLFITGYSEGGAYAMWAGNILKQSFWQNFLTSNRLTLTKIAPASGAYDLKNLQIPFEYVNLNGNPESNIYNIADLTTVSQTKPTLTAYMLTAYATYILGGESNSYLDTMLPNFYNLTTNSALDNTYNLYNVLANTQEYPNESIAYAVWYQAINMPNPDNNQNYSDDNNSIIALVQPTLESSQLFQTTLESASLYSWQVATPLQLFYLESDSFITNLNSTKAYESMSSQSNLVTQLMINNSDFYISNPQNGGTITPIDHFSASVEFMIATLNYFNQ